MVVEIKHYKVRSLPPRPIPNSVYYILEEVGGKVKTYITDLTGFPIPLIDETSQGVVYLSGSGVTGTPSHPIVNIETFVSNQLDNQVYLSSVDGKLQVNPIVSPDLSLDVVSTSTELQIQLSSAIASIVNSALQPGDNVSELVNDAEYITMADIPSSITNLQSVASPTNVVIDNDNGTDATILAASTINAGVLLPGDKVKLNSTTGVNSGDQTSIVGITGTKTQYNTSLTDGDFLFVGDVTQYTNEQAQDAVGGIFIDSSTIDLNYNDALNQITASVINNSITASQLADNINISEFVNDEGYEVTSNKGVPLGYTPLDSNNKVPLIHINDALLGNVKWKGLYNGIIISSSPDAPLNGQPLPIPSSTNTGWYFVSNGTFTNGGKEYTDGDWIISNGITWDRVDNTDSVSSVFGRTGHILAQNGDYTTALVPDTLNKRYVTDANLVTIGNQSGINTGDNSVNTNSNAYADSKVEDLLVDGVTNKAPSQNIVFDALDVKTGNSAGAVQGFALTNNGNGTVNIATGTAFLRATNDQYAPLVKYIIPAVTNLALTDNANNFILVDYNGGTPAITVTTNTATINTETNSLALVVSRVGTTLDWLSLVGQNNDANAKIRVRFLNQEGIRRANGAGIGFTSRNLTLTAGTLFSGLIRINSPAFNTASPDTFTQVYNNGSVWTRTTGQTQVNNTHYNNSGTLTNLGGGDYRTDYIYLLPNNPSKLYLVLGTVSYPNITMARTATPPSSLPVELQSLGVLVGRSIIQRLASSISEVSSAFDTVFPNSPVPEHNALAGIQGGAVNDYQHLTTAEKNDIVHKTGTETITGIKNFNNTSSPSAYLNASVSGTGTIAASFSSNSTLGTALLVDKSAGAHAVWIQGLGTSSGSLLNLENSGSATNRLIRGVNTSGIEIFTVNNTADVTANSYIKTGGLGTQYLMANGTTSTLTNPVTGTGTANTMSKWTGTGVQGDSDSYDNGAGIAFGLSVFDPYSLGATNQFTFKNKALNQNTRLNITGNGTGIPTIGMGIDSIRHQSFSLDTTGNFVIAMNPNPIGVLLNEAFRIQKNGNVGISTNNPIGKLDIFTGLTGVTATVNDLPNGTISFINGASGNASPTMISRTNDSTGLLLIAGTNNSNANSDMLFNVRENDNTDFLTLTNTAFRFSRFSTPLVDILRNGNVGIGTSAPNYNLNIHSSTTASFIQLTTSSTGTANLDGFVLGVDATSHVRIVNRENTSMQFHTNDFERVRIHASGGVSIGNTTDPGAGVLNAGQLKVNALNTAPASATAAGTVGEIRITAGFIYVCSATNVWVRAALATW